MVLTDSRELAQNQQFCDRVRVAAVKTALDVAAESSETANHDNRVRLARQVLMSPKRWSELMAEGVAVNPSIVAKYTAQETITDGDIEFTVASVWDAYAGMAESQPA